MLLHELVLLSNLCEPRVLDSLRGCDSVVRVVDQHLSDEIQDFWRCMWYQFGDSSALDVREVELHVRCMFLEFVKQPFVWSSEDVMNFVDLVQFIVTGKERE